MSSSTPQYPQLLTYRIVVKVEWHVTLKTCLKGPFYSVETSILGTGRMTRTLPNIIITGTPGVGKTIHCEALIQSTEMKHLSISKIVKERGCHEGWDEDFQSYIVDEDKVGIQILALSTHTIVSEPPRALRFD